MPSHARNPVIPPLRNEKVGNYKVQAAEWRDLLFVLFPKADPSDKNRPGGMIAPE